MSDDAATARQILGREAEMSALGTVLDGESPERALLLAGEPGIGKTTVWEAGIAASRVRGMRILAARPAAAETGFSFAGLADLLDGLAPEILASLPDPQRTALDVALLRVEPGAAPAGPRAIAAGLLGILRLLAGRGPVLIAIDDIQWLDADSADALAFAARRLDRAQVRFLLARRAGVTARLEGAFPADAVVRLALSGLSLGAVRGLLSARLGLSPSRRVLRQVVEASGGNPLFALEIGRLLIERGLPEAGEELPIPESISDLVGGRVVGLPTGVRRVLLAVALGHGLGRTHLAALANTAVVEDAIGMGVLVIEGAQVRAAHPLLATAARAAASPGEISAMHRALAGVVPDTERRAHHLARGVEGTDPVLATEVASAAAHAAARGAVSDAADLAARALRLTPLDAKERSRRVLALAERLAAVGEHMRTGDLLEAELDGLPPGESRAVAYLLLAQTTFHQIHVDQAGAHLELALAESPPGSSVQARAATAWAHYLVIGRVERIGEAERFAAEMLPTAERAGGDISQGALRVLALARKLRGWPIDDLCARLVALAPDPSAAWYVADRIVADRLTVRGEVREARDLFHRLVARAEDLDETWASAWLHFQLCELELRAGDWDAAEQLLDEIAASPSSSVIDETGIGRCMALLEAGRGRAAEADRWASRTLAECNRRGLQWNRLETLRASGMAALLAHELARAADSLAAVWDHTERAGVEEPGEFPVAPDLVEVLVELGRFDEARVVSERLRTLAEAQAHPWGFATATRCEALLTLVRTQDPEALTRVAGAAEEYAALGLHFDRARTLFAAGRATRRRRMWGAARDLLEQALAAFEAIGSSGWADEVRAELARIGGRRSEAHGGLTEAEQRVVELAAAGRANKEIAERLVVSVYTVERHLTHAYEKLGVQSRTQLAHRIGDSS